MASLDDVAVAAAAVEGLFPTLTPVGKLGVYQQVADVAVLHVCVLFDLAEQQFGILRLGLQLLGGKQAVLDNIIICTIGIGSGCLLAFQVTLQEIKVGANERLVLSQVGIDFLYLVHVCGICLSRRANSTLERIHGAEGGYEGIEVQLAQFLQVGLVVINQRLIGHQIFGELLLVVEQSGALLGEVVFLHAVEQVVACLEDKPVILLPGGIIILADGLVPYGGGTQCRAVHAEGEFAALQLLECELCALNVGAIVVLELHAFVTGHGRALIVVACYLGN